MAQSTWIMTAEHGPANLNGTLSPTVSDQFAPRLLCSRPRTPAARAGLQRTCVPK
jgi:hypothetical protein